MEQLGFKVIHTHILYKKMLIFCSCSGKVENIVFMKIYVYTSQKPDPKKLRICIVI